uniref:BRCT domain-containing protein n=1 Tax=Solanum lycopersicum TaxID=4081 RepID=A0A3Q7IKK1_SOLLC
MRFFFNILLSIIRKEDKIPVGFFIFPLFEMGGGGRVEVVSSKGCSKLLVDFSSSFRGIPSYSLEPFMSPASSSSVMSQSILTTPSNCPFSGLVICVIPEARKQVKEATERLGGKYSPHLHPQCTHLVFFWT